jgi:hypothetical protein
METGKPPSLTNQGREPTAKGPMKALVAEEMHYIRRGDGLEELYLLKSDPQEPSNVASYRSPRSRFGDSEPPCRRCSKSDEHAT